MMPNKASSFASAISAASSFASANTAANMHSNLLANMIQTKPMIAPEPEETNREKWFSRFIGVIITLNAVQLGICSDLPGTLGELGACVKHQGALSTAASKCDLGCEVADSIFIIVFLIELVYKRQTIYENWKDMWNVLDVTLVATGVLDLWILTPIMRTMESSDEVEWAKASLTPLRLMRILRVIKLLRFIKKLRVILQGLVEAIESMIWIGMLFAVLIYCAAIFGLMKFREPDLKIEGDLNFETLPNALLAMFSVGIAADWTPIVAPIVNYYWWGGIFWALFIFVTSLAMLNLIIGMITERAAKVSREHEEKDKERKKREQLEILQKISDKFFENAEDELSHSEMIRKYNKICSRGRSKRALAEEAMDEDEMKDLIKQIPLPPGWNFLDCYSMFDKNHDKELKKNEFEEGMCALLLSDEAQSTFILQKSIADIALSLSELEKRITDKITNHIDEKLGLLQSVEPVLHGGAVAPTVRFAAEQANAAESPSAQRTASSAYDVAVVAQLDNLAAAGQAMCDAQRQLQAAALIAQQMREQAQQLREEAPSSEPWRPTSTRDISAGSGSEIDPVAGIRAISSEGSRRPTSDGISSEFVVHTDSTSEDSETLVDLVQKLWGENGIRQIVAC